jgi:hypothetical protein
VILNRDAGEEDLEATIATAPTRVPLNIMQSIGDLENEIADNESLMNQIQLSGIPGLKLEILMKNCITPFKQLEEPDEHWDWDIVFNRVVSEIS